MITAVLGLLLGVGAILLGNALEGGHLSALIQPTAALIVFGGTLGCTMLSVSVKVFSGSIRVIPKIFLSKEPDFTGIINQLVGLAIVARKEGLLALEGQIPNLEDEFLAKNLRRIVDGYDPAVLEAMMDDEITHEEEEKNSVCKVYETSGGYSPTIGIIGAVLGLIHVMSNLSDSSKLGSGIAVAFVATIYGVGIANLMLLPMGNRLKAMKEEETLARDVMQTGLLGIQSGLNPRVIEAKLMAKIGSPTEAGEGGGVAERKAA